MNTKELQIKKHPPNHSQSALLLGASRLSNKKLLKPQVSSLSKKFRPINITSTRLIINHELERNQD
jgi:hypothetical protein